jgi:hypothetical protein
VPKAGRSPRSVKGLKICWKELAMADKKLYRVLTPDGQLSPDSFVLASEQPDVLQNDCVLIVNERDGTQLTTHRDRLFSITKVGERKQACLRCGHVLGVVEDQVQCPYDEGSPCDLLEPPDGFPMKQPCAEHSP